MRWVTACCSILCEMFTLLLPVCAALLTLQLCILNVFMHFVFPLPSPTPQTSPFLVTLLFLAKHLEQQGGEKVKGKWKCLRLHVLGTLKRPLSTSPTSTRDSGVPLLAAAPARETHHFPTPRLLDQSLQEREGKWENTQSLSHTRTHRTTGQRRKLFHNTVRRSVLFERKILTIVLPLEKKKRAWPGFD